MKVNHKFIYAIVCPVENNIIYVGQACSIKSRKISHCSVTSNTKISNRIAQIKDFGLLPKLIDLDEVPENESYFWEIYYINLMKSWGFDLLNMQLKYKKATLC